jgi:hypothetical protein
MLEQGVGMAVEAVGAGNPIVAVGMAVTKVAVQAVKDAGGSELEQRATSINANFAAPILTKQAVGALLDSVGVDNKTVKQTGGEVVAVALFASGLLPMYAQLKIGQGLVAVLSASEPEPFNPPLDQILSEGERNALKHKPTALLDLIVQRRRALKMAHLQPGTHTVRVRVSSSEMGGPARFFLIVDGKAVTPELVAVANHERGQRQDHVLRLSLNGAQTVAIACPNAAHNGAAGYRALWLDSLSIEGVPYLPSEADAYHRENLPSLPGQSQMAWRGLMVWVLKPEHRVSGVPVRTRYSAADLTLAEGSSAIFNP